MRRFFPLNLLTFTFFLVLVVPPFADVRAETHTSPVSTPEEETLRHETLRDLQDEARAFTEHIEAYIEANGTGPADAKAVELLNRVQVACSWRYGGAEESVKNTCTNLRQQLAEARSKIFR